MKHSLRVFPVISILLAGIFVHAADPQKKSFSSVMSGTMKSGLPTSTSASFINRIIYPRAGEFLFYSTRWCGDGDVASYYGAHPEEDSGKGAPSVKVVLGYWVDDASVASSVPTANNWYSVAYGSLDVNGPAISKLYRSNTNQQMSASKILLDEYARLMDLAKVAPAGKTYKLYSATMICHEYQGTEGKDPDKESPMATQISTQLMGAVSGLQSKLEKMSDLEKFDKKMRVKISHSKDQLSFALGATGEEVNSSYIGTAKEISDFAYPTGDGKSKYTVAKYRSDVSNLISKIANVISACNTELANETKKYWFEPFALNITCNVLKNADLADLKNKLNMTGADSDSESVISKATFKKYRDQVADRLAVAAILEEAQGILQNDASLNRNKTRCFDPGQRYLNKILASMALPFEKKADGSYAFASAGKLSMPESNYALGAADKYYDNANAVFMNFVGTGDRPGLEFSSTQQPVADFAAALDFNLHLRDVGCSDGPFYCKVDESLFRGEVH